MRRPKPGALIARVVKDPLTLLTIKVFNISPTTSSAMTTNSLFPEAMICSRRGSMSSTAPNFKSVTRILASLISASILAGSVTI